MALPSSYTQVGYIKGTGAEFIDTEITVDSTTRTEVVGSLEDTALDTTSILFGASPTSGSVTGGAYLMGKSSQYATYISWYSRLAGYSRYSIADEKKHTFILDKNGVASVDDVAVTVSTDDTEYPSICLFRSHNNPSWGTGGNKRIYSAKIFKGGEIVCDMIPAKRRSDNELGFYDQVRNRFFTNAGTGTFTYGDRLYAVNVDANIPHGSVYVSEDEVDSGTTVTLWARPYPDYHFHKWSDGNMDNPRQIAVYDDVVLVAEYQRDLDTNGIYQYRCFVKDQRDLTAAPKSFMAVDSFNVKTDLLTNATSSFNVIKMADNVNEGDVLVLYDPTGQFLYNGVITAIEDRTISCSQMQSFYKGAWIYNVYPSTYLEEEVAYLLTQYSQGKLYTATWTDPYMALRLGGITIDYTGSNTVHLPTDLDNDGNENKTVTDMEQFIYSLYEKYGIIFDFEINFSGANYVHIKVPTYSPVKVGNNMFAIQNMSSITQVQETNKLVMFSKDKVYRRTDVCKTTGGIVNAPSSTSIRFNIINTKIVFSDDSAADLIAANLPQQMYNHKVEFDLIIKNFIYQFGDFNLGGTLNVFKGDEYFDTVLTGYEIQKNSNVNITQVHFVCGIVRKKLTQLLTLQKV